MGGHELQVMRDVGVARPVGARHGPSVWAETMGTEEAWEVGLIR